MKIVIKSGTIEVNARFKLKALANGLLHVANAIGAMADDDGEWSICISSDDSICSNATNKITMCIARRIDTEGLIPTTGQTLLIDGVDLTANINNYFDLASSPLPTEAPPAGYEWGEAVTLTNKIDKDIVLKVQLEPATQNQSVLVFKSNPSVRLDKVNEWSACIRKKAVSDYSVIQLISNINANATKPITDILVKFEDDPKEYSFIENQENLLPYDITLTPDQTTTQGIFTLQHTRDEAKVVGLKLVPEDQDSFTDIKPNLVLNPTVSLDPVDKYWKSFINPIEDSESNSPETVYGAIVFDPKTYTKSTVSIKYDLESVDNNTADLNQVIELSNVANKSMKEIVELFVEALLAKYSFLKIKLNVDVTPTTEDLHFETFTYPNNEYLLSQRNDHIRSDRVLLRLRKGKSEDDFYSWLPAVVEGRADPLSMAIESKAI